MADMGVILSNKSVSAISQGGFRVTAKSAEFETSYHDHHIDPTGVFHCAFS